MSGDQDKRFIVYPNEGGRCAARPVAGAADFFEAAILFAETNGCGEGEMAVTVVDSATGEQHCFRLDLDSGDASPC